MPLQQPSSCVAVYPTTIRYEDHSTQTQTQRMSPGWGPHPLSPFACLEYPLPSLIFQLAVVLLLHICYEDHSTQTWRMSHITSGPAPAPHSHSPFVCLEHSALITQLTIILLLYTMNITQCTDPKNVPHHLGSTGPSPSLAFSLRIPGVPPSRLPTPRWHFITYTLRCRTFPLHGPLASH